MKFTCMIGGHSWECTLDNTGTITDVCIDGKVTVSASIFQEIILDRLYAEWRDLSPLVG